MKNYENPSTFVKVTAKKNQWHLFYVDTVYIIPTFDHVAELSSIVPGKEEH